MFKGDAIKVTTTRPFDDVCNVVAEILDDLGDVHISRSGNITIEQARHTGFLVDVNYRGDVRESKRGDGYRITLEYEVNPSTACIVIAAIGVFICQPVALVLLFTLSAQGNVERAVNLALDDIEDALDRRAEARDRSDQMQS